MIMEKNGEVSLEDLKTLNYTSYKTIRSIHDKIIDS